MFGRKFMLLKKNLYNYDQIETTNIKQYLNQDDDSFSFQNLISR
jgi:hypothetical protein